MSDLSKGLWQELPLDPDRWHRFYGRPSPEANIAAAAGYAYRRLTQPVQVADWAAMYRDMWPGGWATDDEVQALLRSLALARTPLSPTADAVYQTMQEALEPVRVLLQEFGASVRRLSQAAEQRERMQEPE